MITIRKVHKSFGAQTLFEDATLQINDGDRFALVGPNGAGKSTLFRMLLGQVEPDAGEIVLRRGLQKGYLPQENAPLGDGTVLEAALRSSPDADDRLAAKAKAILMGLSFKTSDFDKRVDTLSGGWAMRAALASLLVAEPDLLMLDEPTNHLDLDSLLWLQEYLKVYRGAIFLISHDRAFLNGVCSAIVSVQDQTLKVYPGDYEGFVAEREAERRRLESAWRRQQEEIAQMQEFIDRNRARASTASRAQSMIKRLDKLERIELPPDAKKISIRFPQPTRTAERVLTLKNLHKSYGPVQVYRGLDFELIRGWKMAFVGHNGAGKSTLLKLLAGVLPFESGERIVGNNVKVGYYSQHRALSLRPGKTVLQEAMDNDRINPDLLVRTVLGTFLFPGDTVFKKVEHLSGGEKSRLALVQFLLDPPNVLLMDEPTTHLDMASVDALIEALKAFEGTLCVISHDVYFLNALADHVVHVDHGKVTLYPGNYEYFERRQQQLQEEAELGAALDPDDAPAGEPVSVGNPKEERRRRAEERRLAKDRERLSSEIDKAQARVEELARQLQDPAVYQDFAKVKAIGDEMKALQESIAAKEAERAKGA
ncbi:MAG: ABC-F family ATP-binding cassette domain-containing protein [Elusimicrobia bacterium]|nr:ABC-F family ATP-binding cassette domain-containing protein [Elusimicrobiota bacterium]